MKLRLGIILILLCLSVTSAQAATYYVSKVSGANNGNACTAPGASACATISGGIGKMSGSDTLLIQAGTYVESLLTNQPWRNGTAGAYTLYSAYQNDQVIVRPIGGDTVMAGNDTSYIEWRNIIWDGGGLSSCGAALILPGLGTSHHLRISGGQVRNNPCAQGIENLGTNTEVIGVEVHHNAGYGIYAVETDTVIDGCSIHDNGGYGLHGYDGNTQNPAAHQRMIVRNSTFYGNGNRTGGPGSSPISAPAIIITTCTNCQIYNNLIYENWSGIQVDINTNGTKVYNNTLYNNNLCNNCAYASDPTCVNVGQYNNQNTDVRNNICYQTGGFLNAGSGTTLSPNLLNQNPFFLNAAGGNFRIGSAGSPAINAGATLGSPYNVDIEGLTRPAGQYTIGAYQFAAAAAPSFTFTASSPIPSGTAPTLNWSQVTSNGSGLNCSASVPSGGPDTNWTGTTSGQLIAGGNKLGATITATRTYRMTCSDSNGPTTIDRVVALTPPCTRQNFNGTHNVPGTLQADDFDTCSQGDASALGTTYSAGSPTPNPGGSSYRPNTNAFLFTCGPCTNAVAMSGGQGDWDEYTVTASAGTYTVDFYVACGGCGGGTFHLSEGAANLTGAMTVPNTANDTTFSVVSSTVTFTAGSHLLRLNWDVNGPAGLVGIIDRIVFTTVAAGPVASFTGTPLTGTVPLGVTFTDASTGTITSRAWTFGDGGTSTATSPSHLYNTPGAFTVALTVTGPGGSNTLTLPTYVTVNSPGLIGAIVKHTFEEGSGTTAADSSCNTTLHPCTMNTVGWTTGIVGNFGMDANGTRECHFTSTADTRPAHPGMSVWLRCPANAGYSYAGDMGGAWGLWFDPSGFPHVYVNTATGVVGATAAVNVFTNTAHMLSWTLDNTGLRLWIDASQPSGGFTATTAAPIYSGSEVFYWGRNGAANQEYLTGCVVDQGYLFDTPLTQADVTALYNEAQTTSGLSTTHMRVYSDAVEGVPLNAVDTNLTITIGTIVGLRYAVHNLGATIDEYFPLWCSKNGGSQTKVTNSFASLGLRIATSTFVNMGDLTTVPLPDPNGLPLDGFTPIRGRFVADVIDPTRRTNIASGQDTEWEYRVEMGSPATAGDAFVCQPRREADTLFDTYTNLKTVSLQGISPPSSVRLGGTDIGGTRQ